MTNDADDGAAIREPGETGFTYKMKVSLNVLNHLGINLYSNLPAVLSEAVANSWDADATSVSIEISPDAGTVIISDNGTGMTPQEINDRYLTVGYRRRSDPDNPAGSTTRKGRKVMGRKGIGKLSLFSIAKIIEVHSVATSPIGGGTVAAALRLNLDDITRRIEREGEGTYEPDPIPFDAYIPNTGTTIVLKELRKDISRTAAHLRRRLARRFSLTVGEFEISVNSEVIGPEDRDLAKRARYIWIFGPEEYVERVKSLATAAERIQTISRSTPGGREVYGWIGSAQTSTDLKPQSDADESMNRIAVLVRGKLAQEDVLESVASGGVFTKYLSGELHADFLDDDSQADIATSSRQGIVEDDPRFEDFKKFATDQIRSIGTEWSKYRAEDGAKAAARTVPAIDEWLQTLGGDTRRAAEGFIGKIYAASLDSGSTTQLLSSGVIAFEQLRRADRLSVIEAADEANIPALVEVFASIDDIEAAQYYGIVRQRLGIIEKLEALTNENALERVLQDYLFEHLWLLDPGWDRATVPIMEQSVRRLIGEGGGADRVDIKYRTTGSSHVIVELKRAGRAVSTLELAQQVHRYRVPVLQHLRETVGPNVDLQVVCVLGNPPLDWTNPDGVADSMQAMRSVNGKIVLYKQLIENARNSYAQFLEANREIGRVREILSRVEMQASGVANVDLSW